MSLIHNHNHGGTRSHDKSALPHNVGTGSGSRPVKSKVAIPSSAPADAKTLGRSTRGALK